MVIASIETNQDYKNALKRVDELWASKPNTPEGNELDALVTIIEEYEMGIVQ
ncbi:hypothetical protein [Colwellia sp. MEBiC06753]